MALRRPSLNNVEGDLLLAGFCSFMCSVAHPSTQSISFYATLGLVFSAFFLYLLLGEVSQYIATTH